MTEPPDPVAHAARLRDLVATAPASVLDVADRAAIAWALEAAGEGERLEARVAELEARLARLTPPPSPFERERATYRAMLHHLLHTLNAEGQYVVIKGETCFGIERTYEDALRVGYSACGLEPFMVKQVLAVEPVLVMRPTVVYPKE